MTSRIDVSWTKTEEIYKWPKRLSIISFPSEILREISLIAVDVDEKWLQIVFH